MYDKNDEPWDLEAYLADISDSDERARTRREFGGLGYDEDGASAYVPPFGPGPQARLNRAIGGPDDDATSTTGRPWPSSSRCRSRWAVTPARSTSTRASQSSRPA